MRRLTKKKPAGVITAPSRRGRNKRPSVSVDDVIAALLDLFDRLKIDATNVASRVSSLEKVAPSGKFYSHNATIGELLTAWHQRPEYLDDAGYPAAIKMRGRSSFAALAKKVVPTIDPKSLLAQLKSTGAVTTDSSGYIRVNTRSLAVYTDRELAVHYTLTSLRNYIRTLSHNLDSDPTNADQLFHRIAWNDALDRQSIPALKIKLRRQGQNFLESFDNWMLRTSKATTARRPAKTSQVSIGVYLSVSDGK
jgi:hypothetical protein